MLCSDENPRIYNNSLDEVKSYRPPVYRVTKNCSFVEFYAFNPSLGKLCRKRIKVNLIKGTRARKQYANDLIDRLNRMLINGWNPFICSEQSSEMKLFQECLDAFDHYNEHMYASGNFRKQTYDGYKSFNKILREFSLMNEHKITYLYQMDGKFLSSFLDEIFINRGNSARTRNNYLTFLNVLCNFFKDRSWITVSPAEGIRKISSRLIKKQREVIPVTIVKEISNYTLERDPWFHLGCLLLYYCFIRPQEMCRLKFGNIDLQTHTITLMSDQSKNKSEQTITMNKIIRDYLHVLGCDGYPSGYYLFSTGLVPGEKEVNPVIFRHHWEAMRKELKFSDKYKFYSLKDTGITEMAENKVTNIFIRDQARHSSLAITDIYTRHACRTANTELDDYSGSL